MAADFSIVAIGGSQYKVSPRQELVVEKLEGEKGQKVTFSEVLLTVRRGRVTFGKPFVKGASVEAEIIEQFKGKKVRIFKYKAKARYRKRKGHRQPYTKIEIKKV